MKTQPSTPSILMFPTLSSFLKNFYDNKKSKDKRFSYGMWAQSLGGMNRSLLKQITNGDRGLPANHTELFIKFFRFNPEEQRHFNDLVVLSSSKNYEKHLRKNIEMRVDYYKELQTLEDVEMFLETPEIPVLATLFTFKDLPKDIPALANIMNTTPKLLESWIEILESLKFIAKGTDGRWKNTKNSFRIPSKLGKKSLIKFHELSLKKAIKGLNTPKEKRHYEALLVPMSATEYQEYLQLMENFRIDLLSKFKAESLNGRDLYQINLAIHPTLSMDSIC